MIIHWPHLLQWPSTCSTAALHEAQNAVLICVISTSDRCCSRVCATQAPVSTFMPVGAAIVASMVFWPVIRRLHTDHHSSWPVAGMSPQPMCSMCQ